MSNDSTIKGSNAVMVATALGLTVDKYADPTEGEREDLDPESAYVAEVMAGDSGLIYITLDAPLSVEQIGSILRAERISGSDFWGHAMGGDMQALDVVTVCRLIGEVR